MSGIAGIIYPDVFHVNKNVQKMIGCLPCSQQQKSGSIVHRNIEVGTCGQPMVCNEKQTIYAGLAGKLEYVDQLRDELKREGYHFSSETDEELLVHAYEHWGTSCVERFRGSYALFILDKRLNKVLLARDSIGKKTLYWYQDQNHFIFSNSLKALLASGFVPQTSAPESLAYYFYFGYSPQDITPIKGVSKLLPGHYLEAHGDGSMQIESFWSYSSYFQEGEHDSAYSIAQNLNRLLTRAVEANVPENGDVGCFISGGLGSAATAYYLRQTTPAARLKSYSVGYQGQNDDDVLAAMEAASELQIPNKRKMLTANDFLEDYIELAWSLEEPIADITVTSTWQLARLAAGESPLVMSGMGSDELFAGHTRYATRAERRGLGGYLSQYLLAPLAHTLAPVIGWFSHPAAYSMLKHSRVNTWQYSYLQHNALFHSRLLRQAAPRLEGLFDPEVFLNKFYHLSRVGSSTSSFLYFDVKTRLADLYILQYDKLTSANNLNWYSPFLNREVVEYSASLPKPEQMIEAETAHFLKSTLRNLLPPKLIHRQKHARPNFLSSWSQKSDLRKIFEKLKRGVLIESGLISEAWLHEQLATPQRQEEMFQYLWAILALEVWFRLFIYRPISSKPPDVTLLELLEEG